MYCVFYNTTKRNDISNLLQYTYLKNKNYEKTPRRKSEVRARYARETRSTVTGVGGPNFEPSTFETLSIQSLEYYSPTSMGFTMECLATGPKFKY